MIVVVGSPVAAVSFGAVHHSRRACYGVHVGVEARGDAFLFKMRNHDLDGQRHADAYGNESRSRNDLAGRFCVIEKRAPGAACECGRVCFSLWDELRQGHRDDREAESDQKIGRNKRRDPAAHHLVHL